MSNIIVPRSIDKITDQIFIGDFSSAEMLAFNNSRRISHVLNCTPDTHRANLSALDVNQLNVNDGCEMSADSIRFAIKVINDAVESGGRILVHCHAGISRSTSMVIAYLMWKRGISWDQAEEIVGSCRPQTFPHFLIKRSVKRLLDQNIDPTTTLLGGV